MHRTKKKGLLFGAILSLAMLVAGNAGAISITLGDAVPGAATDIAQFAGNDLNQTTMANSFGATLIASFNAGDDGGSFGDIVWSPNSTDPVTATITNLAFDFSDFTTVYAVNKASEQYAVYDLTALGFDGTCDLVFTIFENENPPPLSPGISHISFYGVRGENVADGGGTLLLLGVAMLGLAYGSKLRSTA